MKLQVATYNIHKGVSSLVPVPRVHALKQAITALDSDVIFLQEVQGRHDLHASRYGCHSQPLHVRWPEQAQHEFLAGESHHCAYGMNAAYDHGHHGNALLSKYPIASMSNRDVSDHAYEKRGILHCVLRTPITDVHCYVIHFGLFSGSRLRQTKALIEAVSHSSSTDVPIIIAGDFNDWRNQLNVTLCSELGVCEVFDASSSMCGVDKLLHRFSGKQARQPPRTFPSALPWLRLDRVYVRGFNVTSAEVMQGGVWSRLSDHVPIVAKLELKNEFLQKAS